MNRHLSRARTTFWHLADDLSAGRKSALELTENCLGRIADPAGEGSRTFLKVHAEVARSAAVEIDQQRRAGRENRPFAGIPVSVKDLFDIAGDVTKAGSRALWDAPPADKDCSVVNRIRRAGFIVVGRTNMTEFAYSGLGVNPHFGTPRNPWQRDIGRIPGGSSSGAAVSVADGMACGGIGSDTGGSCRSPAALTGLVGWKPTARRVPLDGVLPLSPSLDSVGCLGTTVEDCRIMDCVMAANNVPTPMQETSLSHIRLGVPKIVVTDGVDDTVGKAFERALGLLSVAGSSVENLPLPELEEILKLYAKGGFPAAESYAWHRRLLERRGDVYDPRVKARILLGRELSAADYIELVRGRADLIERVWRRADGIDALVMPTVPMVAPRLADVEREDDYSRLGLLTVRNPRIANILDCCSISLPMHKPGDAPAGLMLIGRHGDDHALFRIAKSIEQILQG